MSPGGEFDAKPWGLTEPLPPQGPRTEAGRDVLHAVDMIGEANNIDIGYNDWRRRILAIEREAASPALPEDEALHRILRETADRYEGTNWRETFREVASPALDVERLGAWLHDEHQREFPGHSWRDLPCRHGAMAERLLARLTAAVPTPESSE